MSDCIFCKIANKEINSEIVYENKNVVAFKDLNPKAKIHILIVPKKHYETILDLDEKEIMEDMLTAVKEIAKEYKIEEDGFRLINNPTNVSIAIVPQPFNYAFATLAFTPTYVEVQDGDTFYIVSLEEKTGIFRGGPHSYMTVEVVE